MKANELLMSDQSSQPAAPSAQQLREWDRRYVWHPFTQHSLWNQSDPIIIVAGQGEFLIDSDGNRYIDGVSSLWCNVHGHGHPMINAAITEQLGRIGHSTLLGLTTPSAIVLARRLVEQAPAGLNKVFFSDDGSTSVEVACKMAFAYFQHRGMTTRSRFIALRNAYHGDTLGAVSLGGIDLFHKVYRPLLFEAVRAPSPYCYRCELELEPESCGLACADELGHLLERHRDQVAAVVVEPRVQCAGGMITAPLGHLARIRHLCDEYEVLLIADEVATGFGRTGKMFACQQENVTPDLMCLSKGLTAGYLPLAVTLATDEIYNAFLGPIDAAKTFYHGHTFTGNALACAAALASLDVFDRERTLECLPGKIQRIAEHLAGIAQHDHVGEVRQCGFVGGVELVKDKRTRQPYPYSRQVGAQVCLRARRHGVMLRPLADVIVLFPPLSISLENLDRLMRVVARCIEEVVAGDDESVPDGLE